MEETFQSSNFRFAVSLSSDASACQSYFEEVSGVSLDADFLAKSDAFGKQKFKLPLDFKYKDLELKRGSLETSSELTKWCQEVLEGGLTLTVHTRTIKLALMNLTTNEVIESWEFVNAYPLLWTLGPSSDKDRLCVDRIKLSYAYFARC